MTFYPHSLDAESADIAFILESSYPYILGGVSTWVEQIIKGFPQYNFAVIFLGGSPDNYKEGIRYKLPSNLTHLQVHYLFDKDDPPSSRKIANNSQTTANIEKIRLVHDAFRCRHHDAMNEIGNLSLYQKETGIDYEQFLYGEESWKLITEMYTQRCKDTSFIDYFWTIRNIHKPLWELAKIVEKFPKVKVVHTASTGYAGLLSFFVHRHYQFPVILSEHGIYTRERRVDVFLSKNFRDDFVIDRPLSDLIYLRKLWDAYFKSLAQLCYNVSNPIVSLSKASNEIQIEEGASPEKAIIIPNGVEIERFKKLRTKLADKSLIACFVGRLVPMKDVKGFIRAVPNVHSIVAHSKFWIIGSTDQDPQYAEECHTLVENISLQDVIQFSLHQNMDDVLPKVRLIVLNAIREGMPLIILESFAAGVPVVVTDTGACKDMILGTTEEDKALGPAGIVIKVADASALEQAIIEMLTNDEKWEQMSKSAIKRAERYYDQKTMIESYAKLYQERMR